MLLFNDADSTAVMLATILFHPVQNADARQRLQIEIPASKFRVTTPDDKNTNNAEKGGKQAERWSSLAYIKKNLVQRDLQSLPSGTRWKYKEEMSAAVVFTPHGRKLKLTRYLETPPKITREGARERELEWERKNDQAGEDLLG